MPIHISAPGPHAGLLPEDCARLLRAYKDAGAQRVFFWPLAEEKKQLALFMEQVAPLVDKD